jgi:dTDP-4-amino-4,6-dideoxygalactose transaminase
MKNLEQPSSLQANNKVISHYPQRTKDRFLVFGSPAIEESEIEEVVNSMQSGWLGTGPKVAQFEHDFGNYKDATYAVAVNSCTAALHLSFLAAGLKPGDEVITTPLTFCATVNAVIHAGATPVLADVDPVTMNIDPQQIQKKITDKTRAIVPMHFAGRSCDMDAIRKIAKAHRLKIIEDCAHAIETEYKGHRAGTLGDFGCFSFYVTKNIVTGEGGMILAQEEKDAAKIKVLALHGMSKDAWKRFGDEGYKHYQVVECGFKYNMMDIQAAIGIHQLRRVESYWHR